MSFSDLILPRKEEVDGDSNQTVHKPQDTRVRSWAITPTTDLDSPVRFSHPPRIMLLMGMPSKTLMLPVQKKGGEVRKLRTFLERFY